MDKLPAKSPKKSNLKKQPKEEVKITAKDLETARQVLEEALAAKATAPKKK